MVIFRLPGQKVPGRRFQSLATGNRKIPGSRATAMKKYGTSMENLWEFYRNHLQLNGTSMEFPGNGWD